jgi:hypothetical protein
LTVVREALNVEIELSREAELVTEAKNFGCTVETDCSVENDDRDLEKACFDSGSKGFERDRAKGDKELLKPTEDHGENEPRQRLRKSI